MKSNNNNYLAHSAMTTQQNYRSNKQDEIEHKILDAQTNVAA